MRDPLLFLYRCPAPGCGVLVAAQPTEEAPEIFHSHADGRAWKCEPVAIGSAGLHWFQDVRGRE